jgi:hypothetical protein
MNHTLFLTVIGAVLIANALTFICAISIYRIARFETGKAERPSALVYFGAAFAPLSMAAIMFILPE